MIFRTTFDFPKTLNNIDYHSKLVCLGSCFADNIGKQLLEYKFQVVVNPFGVLFHPLAIARILERVVKKQYYNSSDFFQHNELWHNFEVHSQLSAPTLEQATHKTNYALSLLSNALTQSKYVFITLGTAWTYWLDTTIVVANCHKMPQELFTKRLLSVTDIVLSLEEIITQLGELNPEAKVVFTVSPVRHLKDGFIENQRSKSHLIAAIHQVCDTCPKASYFPAYEILMDELRDYRFYADDMIHPSKMAIDYIWERFCEMYFTSKTLADMKQVASIIKGLNHKPFNPNTIAHKRFIHNLNEKINILKNKFPFMDFS